MKKKEKTPIYNKITSRKKLLIEKISEEHDDIWESHYILDFKPESKESCQFLISSVNKGFPTDLLHWSKDYCSFKINILDNIGKDDGSKFLEWIQSFYDKKNDYYRFNIYDNESQDISLYIITKSMKKIVRFYIPDCIIKNPIFFPFNRKNSESPQLKFTLCTKQSIVINHIINLEN